MVEIQSVMESQLDLWYFPADELVYHPVPRFRPSRGVVLQDDPLDRGEEKAPKYRYKAAQVQRMNEWELDLGRKSGVGVRHRTKVPQP